MNIEQFKFFVRRMFNKELNDTNTIALLLVIVSSFSIPILMLFTPSILNFIVRLLSLTCFIVNIITLVKMGKKEIEKAWRELLKNAEVSFNLAMKLGSKKE